MPKISVIIPTYNSASLVGEAVDSVLRQTFTDFEVLVVDDGSVDDTSSVIKNIEESRVKYFYKENGGAASARNFGLQKSTGQYIAWLDSDDLWPLNYLEVVISQLDANHEYEATYTNIVELYPDGSLNFNLKRNASLF